MFSIRKLIGAHDKFFDLLKASAAEARHSVEVLVHFLKNPGEVKALDEFVVSRKKEKALSEKITEELCVAIAPSLEREDIAALSKALYRIPRTVEKIAERILIAPQHLQGVDISAQISLLERAAEQVLKMSHELSRGLHLIRIGALNDELHALEGQADETLTEALARLYRLRLPTVRVVFLKDVFELLEKVVDRCRDAGNLMNHIVMKNT